MTKSNNVRLSAAAIKPADHYAILAAVIIKSAIDVLVKAPLADVDNMSQDQRRAYCQEIEDAKQFLMSDRCQRWALQCGVDIRVALAHPDSKINLDTISTKERS